MRNFVEEYIEEIVFTGFLIVFLTGAFHVMAAVLAFLASFFGG